MDSITQLALGAAVGESVLGRRVGRRAMIWGAICGTLPDLDVVFHFSDAIEHYAFHRSLSHSLFTLTLLAPFIVWLIVKIHAQTAHYYAHWLLLVLLTFYSHVLLDSLTVFGTQIFWPFGANPVTWGTIFIIDPLYTLPLLVGVILTLWSFRTGHVKHYWNTIGLLVSSSYLLWTIGAKMHVNDIAQQALVQQDVANQRYITMPTPFNTLLWRVVVVDNKSYKVGLYSVLDKNTAIQFTTYPRNLDLLEGLQNHAPVQKLRWFSKGFYTVTRQNKNIIMVELRAGFEPYYEFRFKVGEMANPHPVAVQSERLPIEREWSRLPWLWRRIFRQNAT